MKLSILILTHNRPFLFDRCIKSALHNITSDIEIIVNNDSCDITEIQHPNVTYYYNKFENLSQIYQFLLSKATGEYVYYLEDDDYLVNDFLSIDLDSDIIAGNYFPKYHPAWVLECVGLYKNATVSPAEFASNLNLKHLQLSQHIFKRTCIDQFEFPMDNNVHNDINLVLHACSNASAVRTMNKVFYFQTTDSNDNISFPETTPSIEVTKSLGFLDNYNYLIK